MYFLIGPIIGIFLFVLIISIIIIFSFPHFSPIPYFPSNGKDIPLILQALLIRNNQTIIDLGAGDGIVIFKAASEALQNKFNTKFIAIEINPILLLILHIRRLLHPNRKNIRIVKKDMFILNYSELLSADLTGSTDLTDSTFYIYISPWFIEKTIENIKKQIKNFDLISYFYQVKCLPDYKEKVKIGIHRICSYSRN